MQNASSTASKTFIVREIAARSEWDAFFTREQPPTFLQSWAYGEFQRALGEPILRLGIYDGDTLIACCLAIIIRAKRGSILFVPHGPIVGRVQGIGYRVEAVLNPLVTALKKIAREEKCVCIRISSLFEKSQEHQTLFSDLGFRTAPTFMHPERAWILDITADEQTLLSNMRKTTRYSIRKAEKDGVTISAASSLDGAEKFYRLYMRTVERQHFVPFSKKYIEEECRAFSPDGHQFFFAHYQGEIVAGALIIFTASSAFYHHGASTHLKIPAPYLLQWYAILEAKRRGCREYNFWGIAPDDQPRHPWVGLSLFKKGFGGCAREYLSAQDLVLSPWYWMVFAVEWLRRKKRRL